MKALGDAGARGVEGRREIRQPDREERERKDRQKRERNWEKNMQTTFLVHAHLTLLAMDHIFIHHHLYAPTV